MIVLSRSESKSRLRSLSSKLKKEGHNVRITKCTVIGGYKLLGPEKAAFDVERFEQKINVLTGKRL